MAGLIKSFTSEGVVFEDGSNTPITNEQYERVNKMIDGRDGYLVIYEDGYVSWSPKDVFEAGYSQKGPLHKFGDVVEALRHGRSARRAGWDGDRHIQLYDTEERENEFTKPNIVTRTPGVSREKSPMLDQDIFADDWVIF